MTSPRTPRGFPVDEKPIAMDSRVGSERVVVRDVAKIAAGVPVEQAETVVWKPAAESIESAVASVIDEETEERGIMGRHRDRWETNAPIIPWVPVGTPGSFTVRVPKSRV